jgi:hypothetical protein
MQKRLINAGPKRFAAKLGFAMACAIVVMHVVKLGAVAVGIAWGLGLFAFLEAAFALCVGCKIYGLVMHKLR